MDNFWGASAMNLSEEDLLALQRMQQFQQRQIRGIINNYPQGFGPAYQQPGFVQNNYNF